MEMVNAQRRSTGSTQRLQQFLGREITVPAKTVGLSDSEQSFLGKVVDINPEDNSLWCTVSGDKRWYRWHVEDVRSWLRVPNQEGPKAISMPASPEVKPATRSSPHPPLGKSLRSQPTGSKARPKAPGPEQLWKYCKRCNSWKERASNFSKNHRTPDGLQFYCRSCHNRMTKFNQERRLEDRHIAEKHHVLSSPTKGGLAKVATGRVSHSSSRSHSTPSHSKGPRCLDVINSKVPRQQRTHATYRRDSDPLPSSDPATNQQLLKSPSPDRQSISACHCPPKSQRSLGSDNGNQSSHSSAKQQAQQPSQRKAVRSPFAKSQAQASAELMLQANAVLEELDHSLLLAAEVASAEVAAAELAASAAAAAAPSSRHDSKALPPSPVPSSPHASPPSSPVPPRVVSSASPRDRMHSQEQDWGRQERSSNPPVGPPILTLQQRSFSVPTWQHAGTAPSSSLAHLGQVPMLTPADSTARVDRDKQQQDPQLHGQRAQDGPIKPLAALLHAIAEDPSAQQSSADEDAQPEVALELAHEPDQIDCPAEQSAKAPSAERVGSGAAGMSLGKSLQGVSEKQQQQPPMLDGKPVVESGSKAAVTGADRAGDVDVSKAGTSCRGGLVGSVVTSVLHVADHAEKAGSAGAAPQPAASDTAVTSEAVREEASVRPAARAGSSPPASMQEGIPDLPIDSGTLSGPTPIELGSSTDSESAEPAAKKRKVPGLAMSVDMGGSVKTGSPIDSAGTATSSGKQPSSGLQLAQDMLSVLSKTEQPPRFASALAALRQGIKSTAVPGMPASMAPSSLPFASGGLPTGGRSLPTAATLQPSDGLGSIISALALCTSSQQLQGFLQDLQARGNCQQVLEELNKHFMTAPVDMRPPSFGMSQLPLLQRLPLAMATAAEARPQLQPASATAHLPSSTSIQLPYPPSSALRLPRQVSKKRSRPESSNAQLEAAIRGLRSDPTPTSTPCTLSDSSHMFPPTTFPATSLAPNMPAAPFGSSGARAALMALASPRGASAPGPGGAALELSLLLTTLQSLASLPEEQGQAHNTIAHSSQAAVNQLRDWLSQLQQHANDASGEATTAQHNQEDAAIAAQVRKEMWGNLQNILAMLANQGCSPHVHDMVHQIAVHFANEQSQSVALERRMTCVLSREKEAQKQLQQQLRGALQVLTSLQKVLGAVRMQQQRGCSNPTCCKRASDAIEQFAAGLGSDAHAFMQLTQRIAKAETAEAVAQQAVKALQKKEAAWEVELGAAQTSNAQLHKQVAELLQEKAALKKQNSRLERLEGLERALQAERDARTRQLSNALKTESLD